MFHEKESQFELFPGTASNPESSSPSRFMSRRFLISLEGLFVVSMLIAIAMVVAFSLGVERGKLTARAGRNNSAFIPVQKAPVMRDVPLPESLPPSPNQTTAMSVSPALSKPQAVIAVNPPIVKSPEAVKAIAPPVDNSQVKADDKKKNIDKGYTIQVASFKNQEYAEKEATELKTNGYDASVSSKGKHVVVCIGKFATKKEAEQFSKKLKSKYKDWVIRSL